jgi:TRAP-type C4-dicarboxylate transport system permease small subunit
MTAGVVRGMIGALSKSGAAAAALILVGMAAYVLVEIVLRATRGSGTNVLVEFVGYGLAGLTFLAASSTMREGGLVRVSVLLERCGPGVHRALDTLCLLATIAAVALLGWYVGADMWRSFERDYETDSLFPLPTWVPPLPLMLGLVIFLLDLLLHLVLVVRGQARLAEHSPDVI